MKRRKIVQECLAAGGALKLRDLDATHSNGLALTAEHVRIIKEYWLDPSNTRVSANKADGRFIRDPTTGLKDKKAQIQYREETLFSLHRRFKQEVRNETWYVWVART